MFESELKYFITHQGELVQKYRGQTLIIRGEAVMGAYPTPLQAYLAAQHEFEPGTFMIQRCEPGPEAYTVTIA